MQRIGQRPVLHDAAGPHSHLVAVAGIGALRHVVAAHVHEQRLHVRLAHLLVARDVARGQHDALGGVELLVGAVGSLDHHAGDFAALVLHQLFGRVPEQELDALVEARLVQQCRRDEVARFFRDGERSCLERVEVGLFGQDGAARIAGVQRVGGAVLVGLVQQPVHGRAGVLEPLGHQRLAVAVAAGAVPAVLRRNGFDLEAQLLVQARVAGAHAAAAPVDRLGLFDDRHLEAFFHGRAGGGDARVARADDDHVHVGGPGDVAFGNGIGLDVPRMAGRGGRRAAFARTGGTRVARLRLAVCGLLRRAAHQPGSCGQCARRGGSCEEAPARDARLRLFFHVNPPLVAGGSVAFARLSLPAGFPHPAAGHHTIVEGARA